jgi:hypothetical protein
MARRKAQTYGVRLLPPWIPAFSDMTEFVEGYLLRR